MTRKDKLPIMTEIDEASKRLYIVRTVWHGNIVELQFPTVKEAKDFQDILWKDGVASVREE